MDLQDRVVQTIKKYNLIEKGDFVVIGVSGGPDSMALLHILLNLKEDLGFSICVAHINHSLRKEADEETDFVKSFCDVNDIKCYVKKIDVQKLAEEKKISTELAGRNARYDFFEEVAKKSGANKIATAHNANDNAETVLMNLLRGSGVSGLKGIEKMRNNRYIRPIIECERKDIEEYCKINNLDPRYDKSNKENIYTRNKIRNMLIPYIEKEFNPNIVEGLNRLSSIVQKEDEFFNRTVGNEFKKLQIIGDNYEKSKLDLPTGFYDGNRLIVLDLKKFNELNEVIKSRLILYTINELLGTSQGIEKTNIEDIIKLCGNNIGNKYLMPHKKVKVFIKKGKIFFIAVI